MRRCSCPVVAAGYRPVSSISYAHLWIVLVFLLATSGRYGQQSIAHILWCASDQGIARRPRSGLKLPWTRLVLLAEQDSQPQPEGGIKWPTGPHFGPLRGYGGDQLQGPPTPS
jgi:hypothetical protein